MRDDAENDKTVHIKVFEGASVVSQRTWECAFKVRLCFQEVLGSDAESQRKYSGGNESSKLSEKLSNNDPETEATQNVPSVLRNSAEHMESEGSIKTKARQGHRQNKEMERKGLAV